MADSWAMSMPEGKRGAPAERVWRADPGSPSDRRAAVSAALAVAATYVAFLLCAQFGFLAQVEAALGGDAARVRDVFAAMGGAGLAASAIAAWVGARWNAARAVRWGLWATAAASALSPFALRPLSLIAAAVGLGAALGWLTVSLAGGLAELVPRRWVAWVAGWGTGIAYGISNLPALHVSSPLHQAMAGAVACGLAALIVPRAAPTAGVATDPAPEEPAAGPAVRFALVAAFAGLVAVDAAFFARLQRSPEILAASWGTPALVLRQGVAHLLAAVGAGALLGSRGAPRLSRVALVAVAAGGIFGLAMPALAAEPASRGAAWAAVAYAIAIGAYSAALVAAPACAAGGRVRTMCFAAALYGVAGWLGSGFGIGAAQHGRLRLAAIVGCVAFALAGLAVLTAIAGGRRAAGRWTARGAGGAALLLAVAVAAPFLAGRPTEFGGTSSAAAIARGRLVYLAEGCPACHSQYVRAATHDETWWGPARALDRAERPPSPGNRRVGPDLANVGLRRGSVWQEIHLRSPRTVSPGSRMPSYESLFRDRRGPDLVAYLGSLGQADARQRAAQITAAAMADTVGSPARGRPLFARHCVACHGAAGKGDGPLAERFARPTMDLSRGEFPLLAATGPGGLDGAIARAVRFGLPPGLMPGHEWLSDGEVADLVAFVRTLSPGSGTETGVAERTSR
jgi:mono/diheme cytochrome c family protein